jgi:HSP20 family molecular chaperone IbpA
LNQEEKAKDFLSSTSSSLFLFPTITPLTYYDRYSSSSIKEQPKPICNLHNSHSSSSLLNDSLVINNDKIHQSSRLTSTPIRPLISSEILTNNNILDRSAIPTYQPYKSNFDHLNNMSSLRNSSIINSNTHSYDQRISDQGNKYLIQIKTDDYQEDEFLLTVHYSPNQLIIDAKHNEEDSLGGFIRRELHKIFPIPIHIDLNKYTYSYNKNTQELTIEMPYLPTKPDASFISPIQNSSQSLTFSYDNLNLTNGGNLLPPIYSQSDHHENSNNTSDDSTAKNESSIPSTKPFDFDLFHRSAFRPQIIPTTTNENKLLMSLDLSDYQPEDIKISIQDQELIVKAERNTQTDTKKSRSSFFQSTSLPPQTDIEHVQSNYIDGKLIIEAPYLDRQNPTNE